MSKKHFALAAATLLCCTILHAQDSTKTKQLDEVVITATRFPIKQSLTGKVVTVITREELEKNNGKTLGQVLNQQAGLVINGALNSPGTNQTIYMRGSASGRTLILIDGIPAYDPSLINNEFDINLLSINDVQRVEICRGAQSTLYGSDAVAGVINIITMQKDAAKPFNVSTTLAGGNLGTFKGNVQVYGAAGKLSYSARYSKLYTDGFSSARDTSGKGNFDRDGYNGNIANAQLQYRLSDQLIVKTFFQYNQYKADIDDGVFRDDVNYTINNKNIITGGGFQYKHDFLTLTGNYQYSDIGRHYLDDSSASDRNFSRNDYYGKAQFVELYASTKLGGGFTLLQGADYRYAGMNNQYLSASAFGPYKSSFKDTTMSQGSLYASLNYNGLHEILNIELGGRLNVHSRYGSNTTFTFNPSVSLSKHLRVFGSIATGYKAPSLYQLYDGFSGNRNLQPEKSVNYEAGVQQHHDRISNRLVFFYRDINNGIDYNNITFKYFNFFKQVGRGIEWEVQVKPADIVTIQANYTYLSLHENTQNRRAVSKDTAYNYALRRPAHSFNAQAGVQVLPALDVSATIKYVSSRHDVGGYLKQDIQLSSYTLLGAHASYTYNGHLRLFADFQNITGKKFYDANGYNSIPFLAVGGITLVW